MPGVALFGLLFLAISFVIALVIGSLTSPAWAQADLFFSEYVGGACNDEALEVRNGTGGATHTFGGLGSHTVRTGKAAPPVASITPGDRIGEIQGASHTSPKNGQAVTNVPGVVTAIRANGFYVQDPEPDNDPATSEGIFVFTSSPPPGTITIGTSIQVSGTVTEFRSGGNGGTSLTLTEITAPTVTVLGAGDVIAPVVIGQGGRVPPPTIIEDDASGSVETSGRFDPATDGIDFYESLEGMLVQLNTPVVVSPTNGFGEIVLLADYGANAGPRTVHGGIKVGDTYSDFNPERIVVDDAIVGVPDAPLVNVGDSFSGAIVGVIDYSFSNFRVLNIQALPAVAPGGLAREVTTVTAGPDHVTVATFNVENLDPSDGPTKFAALADLIVDNLKSPDVITLEEVQDDNGSRNDAVVDAAATLQTLIDAIVASNGPTYQFRQVNPVDDRDGGEPGGNIRLAFLFNPQRVAFVDRGEQATDRSTTATAVQNAGGQPELTLSPGRIDPQNAAFSDSRKPLVGEFTFNETRFFVVGNHFNSKGGDQPLFGRFQPPERASEVQRQQQAQVVRRFVESILAVDANARVVVIGDLNDFEFSPAVDLLEGAGLVNLVETLPAAERYSYVFEGNSQVLDQILVSRWLAAQNVLAGYDVVHVNAEFADQVSDHDPQVARFTLPPPAAVAPTAPAALVVGGAERPERLGHVGRHCTPNRRRQPGRLGEPYHRPIATPPPPSIL